MVWLCMAWYVMMLCLYWNVCNVMVMYDNVCLYMYVLFAVYVLYVTYDNVC